MLDQVELNDGVVESFRFGRLRARRMTQDDAGYLERLHADREVMAYVGGVRDSAACAAWLRTNLDHWATNGFGQWMLDVDGGCIGRGGLRTIDKSVGEELIEVGYVLSREHWGHGYATEATRSFIEVAVRHYGIDQLGAITLEGNDASTGVLIKCGFVFERWVDHEVGAHKFLRYRARGSSRCSRP